MVKIRIDSEINGVTARWLRQREKLPQHAFWAAVGVSQASGCLYEKGTRPIPASVKKLLFSRYEAGIKLDTGTLSGAQAMRDLAAHMQP